MSFSDKGTGFTPHLKRETMAQQQVIKILYFIPNLGTGGTERLVVDLCKKLDPTRFDAQVCVMKSGALDLELKSVNKEVSVITDSNRTNLVSSGIVNKVFNFIKFNCRLK